MMVRELGFEMKAQPSNRMKTEEELAKEEQERLRSLEVRGPQRRRRGWGSGKPRAPRSRPILSFVRCAEDALFYKWKVFRLFRIHCFAINIFFLITKAKKIADNT